MYKNQTIFIKIYCWIKALSYNFEVERKFISKDKADEPGEEETIYNDETGELFTYHYDTEKCVGKKYNLSFMGSYEARKKTK